MSRVVEVAVARGVEPGAVVIHDLAREAVQHHVLHDDVAEAEANPEAGIAQILTKKPLVEQVDVILVDGVPGEPAFDISPGLGELWVKLRTRDDGPMAALRAEAEALVRAEAAQGHLGVAFQTQDDFAATVNDAEAIHRLTAALDALAIPHDDPMIPLRGSEDFGRFGSDGTRMAMLFLGSGETCPQLHNPDYDFPDALIPLGARLFDRVLRDILG